MEKKLLVLIFLLAAISGFAQEDKLYFSEALSSHLMNYQEKARHAYQEQDIQRADFLFDSLVQHCLKGSFMDNFKVKALNRKDIHLEDFRNPLFLVTYATWLTPSKGEIPALNKLAKEFEGEVDFVVLFWDSRRATKEIAKEYSKDIKVMYVDETTNNNGNIVRTLKHSLGLPLILVLSADKKVINVRRSISHPYNISFKDSYTLNYNSFSKGLSLLAKNRKKAHASNTAVAQYSQD